MPNFFDRRVLWDKAESSGEEWMITRRIQWPSELIRNPFPYLDFF